MNDSESRPKVSIILPTRNGMPLVTACLEGVLAQRTPWPFEIIAIDSESTDGTWEYLQTLPIQLIRIRPQDFNHGRTRNMGAQRARGEFLVFLVQDAIPANPEWLVNLVAGFSDARIVGAYSRQRPRHDSSPITKYMTVGSTPDDDNRYVKCVDDLARLPTLPPTERFELAIFQNNSSCVRRSVFIQHPFDEVPYGEDIAWGKRMIEAGYAIAYEPTSVVFHSHDRSPMYALKRAYADHYQAAELFGMRLLPSPYRLLRTIAWSTLQAWRYVLAARGSTTSTLRNLMAAPVFMAAAASGAYLGGRVAGSRTPSGAWARQLDRQLRVGV